MYSPEQFAEKQPEVLFQFIRDHPLGIVVDSQLFASHLPMVLDVASNCLRCHMARNNSQWQTLATSPSALIVFTGPEHYISPSWYPSKQEHGRVVPTWNYAAVHVYARATVFDGEALLPHLRELTDSNESAHGLSWRIDDAPPSYVESLTNAIVGIEFSIERIEGKWKMSQNRPVADREGVIEGLAALDTHRSLEVRDLMKESRK
jgi:transcriptional regulator